MTEIFFTKAIRLLLMFLLAAITSCASIPKESVDLSTKIGNGIAESQRSHLNLLNAYFSAKRNDLDQWIESEYTPKYLVSLREKLKNEGLSEMLTPEQLKDVVTVIIKERDARQADLEKTRSYVYENLAGHYDTLVRANAGFTALLQSAVSVNDATSQVSETLSNATGGKVDLDKIDRKFDEILLQAGSGAGKAKSLYNEITAITKAQGDKP